MLCRPRMTTLQDILKREQGDGADNPDEGETYFAGGEKSGTMMQGAARDDTSGSLIDRILKKAAQGSAPPETLDTHAAPRQTYFTGAGYRLGSDEVESQMVNSARTEEAEEEHLGSVVRRLTFWRTGFTIDDGPLQSYDDPANKAFLMAINSGQAPLDRLNVKPGQPVELSVERRLDQDYVPSAPAPASMKPFAGAGQRLGSPVTTSSAASASSAQPATAAASSAAAPAGPTVDESQPVTTLQIRLADGSRQVARFNHDHTVGQLRQFVIAASSTASRPFVLQTTFPPRELKDDAQTLKEAGLLNSVIMQRFV
ncbi:ubiquitin-related domain-containing protein [Thamnocephalis sphaerospora]|uniref:Ubiquitin-related domain-containing protein n=1 Tax=Thamnocephalis sphaerospora TaxID=78915 RepID=A0A4P9XR59_9FUNG|nr:ubiquitin-related domain-containing protein [Thamnocephalis sphaerospora]|eukprot:RKP08563.1 ubiquitin-related domain-containing protein [Thamnocephalis sphaerospora]